MPKDLRSSTTIRREVAEYFAALPKPVRTALRTVEARVHAALPNAEQGFTYRIPCLRLEDRPVVWYAGFKKHVSLFPMTPPIVKQHAVALRGLHTSKGTIRFPLDALPSAALVKKLVRARLVEMQKESRGRRSIRGPQRGRKPGRSRRISAS